jgi:hypothetical protein
MNLQPNEKELWSGKPKQGIFFHARDVYLIPFSLLWCGFAIFWTIGATSRIGPGFFTVWGSMFVGTGLYIVFGRFIHDRMLREQMMYYVTDKRVIITRKRSETSIPINQWACLELDKFPDGTGTIRFATQSSPFSQKNFGVWLPSLDKTPQFMRIEDPDHVMSILNEQARAKSG